MKDLTCYQIGCPILEIGELGHNVENYIWEVMVKSSIGWLPPNSLPIEVQEVVEDFIYERILIKLNHLFIHNLHYSFHRIDFINLLYKYCVLLSS